MGGSKSKPTRPPPPLYECDFVDFYCSKLGQWVTAEVLSRGVKKKRHVLEIRWHDPISARAQVRSVHADSQYLAAHGERTNMDRRANAAISRNNDGAGGGVPAAASSELTTEPTTITGLTVSQQELLFQQQQLEMYKEQQLQQQKRVRQEQEQQRQQQQQYQQQQQSLPLSDIELEELSRMLYVAASLNVDDFSADPDGCIRIGNFIDVRANHGDKWSIAVVKGLQRPQQGRPVI